jgi:hypothetical protein
MNILLVLPLDIKREISRYNLSSCAYYYIYDEEFRNSVDIGLITELLEWHIDNECTSAPLMKELAVKLYELKMTFVRRLIGVYTIRAENHTISICDNFVEYRNHLAGFISRDCGKLPAKVYMNGDQYFYKGVKLIRKRVNGRYIACV